MQFLEFFLNTLLSGNQNGVKNLYIMLFLEVFGTSYKKDPECSTRFVHFNLGFFMIDCVAGIEVQTVARMQLLVAEVGYNICALCCSFFGQFLKFYYRIYPCIVRTFFSQNEHVKLGVHIIHG